MKYGAISFCVLLAGSAAAQPIVQDDRAQALLTTFSSFCLERFPDDKAVDAFIAERAAVKHPIEAVSGKRDGNQTKRAWTLGLDGDSYELVVTKTVSPPRPGNKKAYRSISNACSVTIVTSMGFSVDGPFAGLKQKYAQDHGLTLTGSFALPLPSAVATMQMATGGSSLVGFYVSSRPLPDSRLETVLRVSYGSEL